MNAIDVLHRLPLNLLGEKLVPSFDIVSEVDIHALTNAVDQASRVVDTRFDFKGVDARFEREGREVVISAQAEFQVTQMVDMLRGTLVKSAIDPASMELGEIQLSDKSTRQMVTLRHGLETDLCRKIVKLIKATKLKVQAAIQGEKVRVTGKKRDDLQQVMAMLREAELDMPLQFDNFRD
jgi:uncharacterized protein YajQ (UPF0234 family)